MDFLQNLFLPWPGGVIYVRRTFDNISPSLIMPTPILLALPSNPMATTIILVKFHRKFELFVEILNNFTDKEKQK